MNWDRAKREDRERKGRGEERLATLDKIARAPTYRRADEWRSANPYQKVGMAADFAMRWRTWPENGDRKAAFDAAYQEAKRNPRASKFDVAKVAIQAATAAARRLEQ
jgi:hypothetical protein